MPTISDWLFIGALALLGTVFTVVWWWVYELLAFGMAHILQYLGGRK